jgi:hypothetical protein
MAPNPQLSPREIVPNSPELPASAPSTPVSATALRIVGGLLIAGGAIVALMAIVTSTEVIDRSGPGAPSNLTMANPGEVWSLAMGSVSRLASSAFAFGFASVIENLARIESHLRTEPKRTVE